MQSADKYIRSLLSSTFSDREASQISSIILDELYSLSRLDIIMNRDVISSSKMKEELDQIISRLLKNEPIQYIIGHTPFMNLNFNVKQGVLIPRPETAELVELILKETNIDNPSILDIGTGSGCIAISLANNIRNAVITAFDISDIALETASENAIANNANVKFIKTDILNFDPSIYNNQFDIIVSNPPYIGDSEIADMERNVTEYEPHLALFVPDNDPLLFYRNISFVGKTMLKNGGKLYFEINSLYGSETASMLQEYGYTDISVIKDLQGNDRIVSAIFNNL